MWVLTNISMADRSSGYIINYAILGLGYLETIVGIMQWIGMMPTLHPAYPFTGTFYNPGPYACFLSIVIPVAVYAAGKSQSRLAQWSGTGMVLIGAILIPASLSRTAMLAAMAGSALALRGGIMPRIRKAGRGWLIAGILALSVGAAGLYIVKKDSADGRLLIWKVAAEAALDAPLTGTGWDNVAGAYGDAQERYFASGRGSEQEKMVADAPEYVFNEYLQVAIAFGLPTALLMTAMMAGGIATAMRSGSDGLAGSAAAMAIVMFSSYPLQFPLFAAAGALVFAGCYMSAKNITTRLMGCLAVAACCALFLANDVRTDVHREFSIALSLHRQSRHVKSNALLLDLTRHSSDPMILNIIAKNHRALGQPDSAAHYLRRSAARCPNRLYSHYLLMQLYADSLHGDLELCRREAETMLRMEVKIKSPATEQMLREARCIIEN